MIKWRKKTRQRQRIGPYQILAKLGDGALGSVYLAKMDGPIGFNKLAVVKELRSDLTESLPTVEAFLNEVRLAARVSHPNVVHTYGANDEGGTLYLAVEYLDGQPWSQIRRVLKWPLELHLHVLAEVLVGLHYAHEQRDYDGTALNVVHGEVSPRNVFVTYDGQVKVADFGTACVGLRNRRVSETMSPDKLAYIAPEQARDEPGDRRADIFAVGVMLWEVMAGKAFAQDEDARVLRERRAHGREPRVREVMPDAPAKLADICDRALSLAPSDRFATAGEFREALVSFVGSDTTNNDRVQLGELVVDGFRQERTAVRELIDRRLNELSAQQSRHETPVSGQRARPRPVRREAAQQVPAQQVPATRAPEGALVAGVLHRARAAWLRQRLDVGALPHSARIGAAVGVAILTLLAFWLGSHANEPTTKSEVAAVTGKSKPAPLAPPPPKVEASPTAPPPPPARDPVQDVAATLQLRVAAVPPEASLTLDGTPLLGNPAVEHRALDNELHVVRAVGPGLQSQQRVIAFDRDHSVTFNLTRSPQLQEPRVRGERRTREAPQHAPRAAGVTTTAALPTPAAPPSEGPDYDVQLIRKQRPRPIYEENPY